MVASIWRAKFKLEWAKKHLDSLEEVVLALERTGGNRITTYDDIEDGFYVITTHHSSEVESFRVILMIGDFISSLRASLDHLAWQLALLTTPEPSSKLTFPIFEKNTADAQKRFAQITVGIPEQAIALMESMQPYHAGDDYKSTPLWRLNKIWNIDKHRHITGFREIPDSREFRFRGIHSTESSLIQTEQFDNKSVMRLPLAIKEQVDFNPNVKVKFEINESSEGIIFGYEGLVEMYRFVAETVFPVFADFFPPSEEAGASLQAIEF